VCGITGFHYQGHGSEVSEQVIAEMTKCLYPRGPDGQGLWFDHGVGIALGHRRLSIQDTSDAGAQPMHSDSDRYVITFNGEIYNFLELKSELIKSGAIFKGGSDTEVILASFEQWGIEQSIRYFVGMFAFSVLDRQNLNYPKQVNTYIYHQE